MHLDYGIIIVDRLSTKFIPLLFFLWALVLLVGSHCRDGDEHIVTLTYEALIKDPEGMFLKTQTQIPIQMTHARPPDPEADWWNGNRHRDWGWRRFPNRTLTRNFRPHSCRRRFSRQDSFGKWRPILFGRWFPYRDSFRNRRPHWNPNPFSKCRARWKPASGFNFDAVSKCSKWKLASDYHADAGFRFDYCSKTYMQHFVGAGFRFHPILGTGIQLFMGESFRNYSNF